MAERWMEGAETGEGGGEETSAKGWEPEPQVK